jgi:hypothetical protein
MTVKGTLSFDTPVWNQISTEAKAAISGLLNQDP